MIFISAVCPEVRYALVIEESQHADALDRCDDNAPAYKLQSLFFQNVTWTNETNGYIPVRVTLRHDDVYNPSKSFSLRLAHHPTLYHDSVLATPLEVVVTIRDEAPGTVQFSNIAYNVSEGDGDVYVGLERIGGSVSTVEAIVRVDLSESTAAPGVDFLFVEARVTWAEVTLMA